MISIKRIRSFEEINADEWNALLENSEPHFLFQTYEYQKIWWRNFGGEKSRRSLFLLGAYKGTNLVGIAPLMAERTSVGITSVKFIGTPICDYIWFIIGKDGRPDIVRAFIEFVKRSNVHLAELYFVPEEFLRDAIPGVQKKRVDTALALDISDVRGTFYENIDKRMRQDILRCERNLGQKGAVTFGRVENKEDIDSFLARFTESHIQRWKVQGGKYSQYQQLSWRNFTREISHELIGRKNIDLSYIKAGGEYAALHFGFIYDKRFYYYMPTYNPMFYRYSPSKILIMRLLEYCKDRGILTFDFLRGREQYKTIWSRSETPLYEVTVFSTRAVHRAG